MRICVALALVLALLVGSSIKETAQAAPSPAGWTAIIVAGTLVLYEFGYRYPIDNKKIKAAWAEAEQITKASYDTRTPIEVDVNGLDPMLTLGPIAQSGHVDPDIIVNEADGSSWNCTMVPIVSATQALKPRACGLDTTDPEKPRIRVADVIGYEYTFDQVRAQAIQALIAAPKSKDAQWRAAYQTLSTCWNKVIYADPSPSPSPSASPKASPSSSTSPSAHPSPSHTPGHPSQHKPGQGHPGKGQAGKGKGNATKMSPQNWQAAVAAGPAATTAPTPSASPSSSPIAKDACTYGLASSSSNLEAPSIVDPGDSIKKPIYVDLIEATAAFANGESLRQQIVDRRVGPNTVINLERAEVVAHLAGAFYASVFQPTIQYSVNRSATRSPSTGAATSGPLNELQNVYGSCVNVKAIDPQTCLGAIQEPEQELIGSIATKNACAFASDHWLPSITAVGKEYGTLMGDSTAPSYRVDLKAIQNATADLTSTPQQAAKSFGSVPGC